jgi:Methylase involved in ubiquinone/menaquinone biosynthesis
MADGAQLQTSYYKNTAEKYDEMHVDHKDEHTFALSFMLGMFDFLGVKSVLDIGSGTGRALSFIKERRPDIRVVGIEPVDALREIGYKKGLGKDELIDGDGLNLQFKDGEFDLVCEFGVLHHVPQPNAVIEEMLRVGRKAIFISDNNIYGDPSPAARLLKQAIQMLGLWKLSTFVRTRGKGYTDTEIDGIAYYYSVFDSFDLIKAASSSVHYVNPNIWTGAGENLYRTATHIALLGILK